jgi:hypothetical protein
MPSETSSTLVARLETLIPRTSAIRAMIPPSPWLSARMTSVTYLTDTTSVIAQKTSEMIP